MNKNILVTAAGGDIGQSIGKILKENKDYSIVGCDISDENAGVFIFDNFEIVPMCSSINYLESLNAILDKYKIELIIPTSEAEIKFFMKEGYLEFYRNIPVVAPSQEILEIGFDKLATANFLKQQSLPYPITEIVSEMEEVSIPCIVKSRQGAGSKNIFKVKDKEELKYISKRYADYIAQELLLPDDEEYTCGVYRSSLGEIRTITFKRQLKGGATGYGITVIDSAIENVLVAIAEKSNLIGSVNVQLRNTEKGPMVFEINPRFSSTVLFRHLLGFQDLVWAIQDRHNMTISAYNPVQSGRKIYKGYSEYIK